MSTLGSGGCLSLRRVFSALWNCNIRCEHIEFKASMRCPGRGTRELDESGNLFQAEIQMWLLGEWVGVETLHINKQCRLRWWSGTPCSCRAGEVAQGCLMLNGSKGENGSGSARIVGNSAPPHCFYGLSVQPSYCWTILFCNSSKNNDLFVLFCFVFLTGFI